MPSKRKQKPAKITINTVYFEHQPLSANTPSVEPPIGLNEDSFSRDDFMKALEKVSRPDKPKTDQEQ